MIRSFVTTCDSITVHGRSAKNKTLTGELRGEKKHNRAELPFPRVLRLATPNCSEERTPL